MKTLRRLWIFVLILPIVADAYKSRHNKDHLRYSRHDPRHYIEYNRNRHPSQMVPVPGSRHRSDSYRRYSRYDGRFWEGHYANGGGKPCAVSLTEPLAPSPYWVNAELKALMEKAAVPESSPEEVIANALLQSPEWLVLSRELRELSLYFYGSADRARFTSQENQLASRHQLMSEYLYVLRTSVSTMIEVVGAFEKLGPANRNPLALRQLAQAVQLIRGSRVSIETISYESVTFGEVAVGMNALTTFDELAQRLNRLSLLP